jgi:Tol biopolymer transport system component
MERERWVEIESLLRSTLDQPADLRENFLKQACGGDTALRGEVEALLNLEDGDDFLEVPALDIAARALAAEKKCFVGALIGRYRILKPLGSGGMGEVFLAEDIRLGRQIALKILPAEFAVDASRVQRFELEARAASALNHPNVLVIHDIGVHDGVPYIASEYLQGETLRDRLNADALPISKAVEFAVQIAHALAAAHENGIVHRDLKPENIFVTADGRIKILDFGLAKLIEQPRDSAPGVNPTLVLTAPHVIMGSIGYLAPEQIRGQEAVRSSDIFAFGCVLYEMLTGRRAFSRDSDAETIAAILHEEPPNLENLPDLPPVLTRTIRHCLEKRPLERFQSAHDLAFTLEGWLLGRGETSVARSPAGSGITEHLGWIIAGLLALVILALSSRFFARRNPEAALARFEIPIPGDPVTGSPALAISPNGKYLAFLAMGSKGRPIIWTRAMNAIAPRPVSGSEDAQYPFWSADSRFLAYHVGDKLKAMEIATGGQRTICTIRGVVNGAWNSDGLILVGTGNGPLLRIPLYGDHPEPGTKLDYASGQRAHWWPSFLPDNRHFLYTVNASTLEKSGVFVASLDRPETRSVVTGVITNATYVPGYLLYSRDGNLLARPFDPVRLEVTGAEVPVVEKLRAYYGYTAFSASKTGTLVFRTGDQGRFKLAWFDRAGKQSGPIDQKSGRKWTEGILPLSPSLSPDGSMVATVQNQPSDGAYGIWVSALTRTNIEYPVTAARNAEYPVWSPDGNRIAYSASPKGGARDLFVKRLDEPGDGKLVFHSANDKWPVDWSSDGRNLLLFFMNDAQGRSGLWVVPLTGNSPPTPIPGAPTDIKEARFSPDGHWLAYTSDQSGTSIVYIQDFPKGESRIPISDRGASNPQWRRDGSELFYLSSQDDLMSVPIGRTNGLSAGTPQRLFKTSSIGINPYTVTPDGQHFLVQMPVEDSQVPVISVTLNWTAALKK